MRFAAVFAAFSTVLPLVAAHGDVPGMPKIFGIGPGVKRDLFGAPARRAAAPQSDSHGLNKRQGGLDGQCGPQAGGAKCADGYCCSPTGWCGNSKDYCAAPDCLIDFGSGCDALKIPNGADTRNVARPQTGNVLYGGEGIYPCKEAGTVALTYDDGPYIYTSSVLDALAAYNMKATFFVTGINNGKGAIDDASTPWPGMISRMAAEGHQVASHTWSHQDLSIITQAQRIDQMTRNEMAIRNIIQKFPTYMRPPYSSCNAACAADMATLGYHIVYFNLDTDDYDNTTPNTVQNAKNNFAQAVLPSNVKTDNFLTIMHDIHQQTALNLTASVLDTIKAKGYRAVTVGECLGDPEANWYRSSSGRTVSSSSASSTTTSAAPTSTPTGVSLTGECGPVVGLSCIGFSQGSCCSAHGYCGATPDHCGTGCQSIFGTCGSSSAGITSVSSVSTTAPVTPSTVSTMSTSTRATSTTTPSTTPVPAPSSPPSTNTQSRAQQAAAALREALKQMLAKITSKWSTRGRK